MTDPQAIEHRKGVLYSLLAYGWWGFIPLYFHVIRHVPALEILAHRVAQSTVFLIVIILAMGRWSRVREVLASARAWRFLIGTTIFIALNWLVYIHAIQTNRVLHASLGYYINPLVNVMLGFLFLGERLGKLQIAAFVLAGIGVAIMAVASVASFPWIALVLAFSFGFYGLLRKVLEVDALTGLTVETMLLTPLALIYLWWIGSQGTGQFFSGSTATMGILLLAGVVTAVPLLAFAAGARRLTLTTLGFLQYTAPTLQFMLAVAVFGETFTWVHAITFACIWAGLVIFTIDGVRRAAERRRSRLSNPVGEAILNSGKG